MRFIGTGAGGAGDPEMSAALRLNLQSALHTALILLPETFTEEQFYMTLAGLSYTGDFRMVIGEDRNKVANIVRPNLEAFRRLFASRLADLNNYVEVVPELARGDQDTSSAARHFHLNQLPKTLQWNLVKVCSQSQSRSAHVRFRVWRRRFRSGTGTGGTAMSKTSSGPVLRTFLQSAIHTI